ncbi:MAG: response regulator, partial [Acidobacteriaceae bacterium]
SLEALSASRSKHPEVLIADVVMPQLSGIDLAIGVKECCPGCKVLLFSGHWPAADFPQLAHGNVHQFELISKPVHPRELIEKVRKMVLEVSSDGTDGEDRVRRQVAENMRQTVDEVKADIANTTARKRSVKRRAATTS